MTILERLTESVGLTNEAARTHLAGRYLRVDGEIVTDPDAEVTATAKLLLVPPGDTGS